MAAALTISSIWTLKRWAYGKEVTLISRAESRLGQDSNEIDGAVAPSNFAMALPLLDQDVTALTGVQYTQDFSEHLSVFCGKLNLLDGTPSSYIRAARLNYFSNAAMQSNLSRSYLFLAL